MKPTIAEVLEKERPWLTLDDPTVFHMMKVSMKMMEGDGPIEVRVHAMEIYLQILKEMSLRN
jgi:hypothetical protein